MMATATPSMEEKSCTINMPCPGGLGIQLGDEEKEGLGFITRVVEGSEAEQAGVVANSTILQINGTVVTSKGHIRDLIAQVPAGDLTFLLLVPEQPIYFFKCVVDAAATTIELDFDISTGWEGGHLFRAGDIVQAIESGTDRRTIKRVKSKHGWVSRESSQGTVMLEPMVDEVAAAAELEEQIATATPLLSMLSKGMEEAKKKSVEMAELAREKAREFDEKNGLSVKLAEKYEEQKKKAEEKMVAQSPKVAEARAKMAKLNEDYRVGERAKEASELTKKKASEAYAYMSAYTAPLMLQAKDVAAKQAEYAAMAAKRFFTIKMTRPLTFGVDDDAQESISLRIYF